MADALKRRLDHWLFCAAFIAPEFVLIAAAWTFEETGSWGAVRFLVVYALPMFIAAPLWARTRVRVVQHLSGVEIGTDVLVLVLSVARFAASEVFPFSGHMLFLVYTLLTSRTNWYRWLAIALIVQTTWFKLVMWRDQRSWMIGLLAGFAAAAISRVIARRRGRLGVASFRI